MSVTLVDEFDDLSMESLEVDSFDDEIEELKKEVSNPKPRQPFFEHSRLGFMSATK